MQAAVKENPDDLQLKVDLAIQLHQANKADEALPLLFVNKEDLLNKVNQSPPNKWSEALQASGCRALSLRLLERSRNF